MPASTRETILKAAGPLLLKHGLRSTSMEAIARAAGVAKPTLYAYFADKGAVFTAIAEQIIAGRRSEFLGALGGDGGIAPRAAAALAAHFKGTMRLAAASPHAAEMYSARDPLVGAGFAAFEADLTDALEAELARAGTSRPRLMAQLLLAAAAGIAQKAQSPAELGPALRLLCDGLLRQGQGAT